MTPDRALTVPEVATRIGVSVATVRRLYLSGQLAYLIVGARSVRIMESEVARYLRDATDARGDA